jgi:quinol monooxygenase YgiN
MIAVKVTYTINEEYISSNKQRIETFLQDFKKLNNGEFLYSVFQKNNGSTFVHLSQYANETIQQQLLNVPSFLAFQEERDKNLSAAPQIEMLKYVGASREVL